MGLLFPLGYVSHLDVLPSDCIFRRIEEYRVLTSGDILPFSLQGLVMTLFWFDSWIWKDLLVTGIQKTPSRFIVISIKLGLSSEVGWRLDRGELDSLVRRHVFLTSCFR